MTLLDLKCKKERILKRRIQSKCVFVVHLCSGKNVVKAPQREEPLHQGNNDKSSSPTEVPDDAENPSHYEIRMGPHNSRWDLDALIPLIRNL